MTRNVTGAKALAVFGVFALVLPYCLLVAARDSGSRILDIGQIFIIVLIASQIMQRTFRGDVPAKGAAVFPVIELSTGFALLFASFASDGTFAASHGMWLHLFALLVLVLHLVWYIRGTQAESRKSESRTF